MNIGKDELTIHQLHLLLLFPLAKEGISSFQEDCIYHFALSVSLITQHRAASGLVAIPLVLAQLVYAIATAIFAPLKVALVDQTTRLVLLHMTLEVGPPREGVAAGRAGYSNLLAVSLTG